jgi:hypothetical protein
MTETPLLNVSLSAVQSYRQCQQQYAYRYVEKLRRKDRGRALELGLILHKYLETYYQLLKDKKRPSSAHKTAQLMASAEYSGSIRTSADHLIAVGLPENAKEMLELLPLAGRLTDRYFATHGESDADEYEILLVEEWINFDLLKGVRSNGKLDLYTRNRYTKRLHLWEHKSTKWLPSREYRLRDLQTTLYVEKLIASGMIPARPDAVNWNYIYTKEPTKPELLKNGTLTIRSNLDSTWETYLAEIKRLKLNPDDYQEQRERLQDREETVFFPRFEQVILADARILLTDYVQTVKEIKRSRRAWAEKTRRPVRTLTMDCDYCEYKDLCNAALLAGTDRDARSRFTREAD